MSTRTTRVFRDEGFFEYFAQGPVLLDRLDGQSSRRHIKTAISLALLLLTASLGYLAFQESSRMTTAILGGLSGAIGVFFLAELINSLFGGKRKIGGKRGPRWRSRGRVAR